MSKLSLLIIILFLVNACSINKKQGFWNTEKSDVEEIEIVKKILTKQIKEEEEFNATLKIKISEGNFNKNFNNNQNYTGETYYEGGLEKVGKYKFSKFENFKYLDAQPVFYNDHLIFYDNKGTIILYDQNQKVVWKKKTFIIKVKKKLNQD